MRGGRKQLWSLLGHFGMLGSPNGVVPRGPFQDARITKGDCWQAPWDPFGDGHTESCSRCVHFEMPGSPNVTFSYHFGSPWSYWEVPWTPCGAPRSRCAVRIRKHDFQCIYCLILGPFWITFGSPGLRFWGLCYLRVSMLALCILRGRQQSEKIRFRDGRKRVWHGKYAVQLNVANFASKTRFGAI